MKASPEDSNPSLVEITAVVERALNYMHTGNAKVISTSTMNPLWIGFSIIYDGLPCFNGTIVNTRNPGHGIVNLSQWPFDERIQRPKSASKSGLLHYYGPDVFNVSFIHISNIVTWRHFRIKTQICLPFTASRSSNDSRYVYFMPPICRESLL
jgi:hypothetical protein